MSFTEKTRKDNTDVVVLAAGAAERLPNKLILPIKNSRLMVESALGVHERDEIGGSLICVTEPGSKLPRILRDREANYEIKWVIQPRPLGVTDAISRVANVGSGERVLILFGDNVYDKFPISYSAIYTYGDDYASIVSKECITHSTSGLDVWKDGSWVERDNVHAPFATHVFAGFLYLRRSQLTKLAERQDLIQAMNALNVSPIAHDDVEDWWDLGTPEAYSSYWAH